MGAEPRELLGHSIKVNIFLLSKIGALSKLIFVLITYNLLINSCLTISYQIKNASLSSMSSEMSNVIMKYSIPSLSSVEQNDRNFCFDCVYILIS